MKLGVFIFATDYAMRVDEVAKAAEERGFESLFVPEHTHIPASRRSAWPGGAELPREYWHTSDPFVALTAAAAATSTLRIGTGICLLSEHEPLATAKAVASLDLLSGGRVELGIGAGWNAEEMENHGTAFGNRFAVMSERARAMKALWQEEEPAFHGRFVHFDKVWSWPKPVQAPHPPILIGGESIHTLRRVVAFGNGWLPRARGGFDAAEAVAQLRAAAEQGERDAAELTITVFGAPPRPAVLEAYREAGIDRALLALPSADADVVRSRLDEYAALLATV